VRARSTRCLFPSARGRSYSSRAGFSWGRVCEARRPTDRPARFVAPLCSAWMPEHKDRQAGIFARMKRRRADTPERRRSDTPKTSASSESGFSEPPVPPWIAIAEQAQQPTNGAQDDDSGPADSGREKSVAAPGAHQWLPPDMQREENPLASGTWLPAGEPAPPRPSERSGRVKEATRADEQPLPRSSWLPSELASEATAVEPAQTPHAPEQTGPPVIEPKPQPVPQVASGYGRRSKAVEAYCRELFPSGFATAWARQILDSLTGGISDDGVLLEMTRAAAAKQLARGSQADGASGQRSDACAPTAARLAARANGTITAKERAELEEHLGPCLVCRALELRAGQADRAFAAIMGLTAH
jgi:hypothetical protein